jgi:hypothetical protein
MEQNYSKINVYFIQLFKFSWQLNLDSSFLGYNVVKLHVYQPFGGIYCLYFQDKIWRKHCPSKCS